VPLKSGSTEVVTFLDTPGHAAFENMRINGSYVADLGILVVALDEGVQPQTIEAVRIAREECIPLIVALNKTDLALVGDQTLTVKTQLRDLCGIELIKPLEEINALSSINLRRRGRTKPVMQCQYVAISSKERTNIDQLVSLIHHKVKQLNLLEGLLPRSHITLQTTELST